MASSLGPSPSLEEVDDEIAFQNVRLKTLDPDAIDYETDKRAIEEELKALEDMLHAIQNAPSSSAGHSNITASQHQQLPGASAFNTTPRAQRIAPVTSTYSLPPPTFHSPAFAISSNNMNGKRGRDDDASHYKPFSDSSHLHRISKRATPSPAPSFSNTPDSLDELEEADAEMRKFTAVDPAVRKRALADRRERERARLECIEQFRKDEEFARRMSIGQDLMSQVPVRNPLSRGGSQAILNANGTYRKQMSAKPSSSSLNTDNRPALGYPSSSSSYRTPSGFTKAEAPAFGTPSRVGASNAQVKTEHTSLGDHFPASAGPSTPESDDSDLQISTADAFNAASAHKIPRSKMPGGFPAARAQQPPSLQYGPRDPFAPPPGYQGYTAYQPSAQPLSHVYGGPGMQIPEQLQQAFNAAGNMLKNNPALSALPRFQDLRSQVNDMVFGKPNPYNPNTANPYNGLGYNVDQSRPMSSVPFNPRDLIDIDGNDDNENFWGEELYTRGHVTEEQQMAELKALLDNIKDTDDSDPALREPTPEALREELYPHQRIGLAWMKRMEEGTNRGGILADDMGLGKTIQALSLIVSRPSQDQRRKTTLIVAPVALMRQWATEITTKLKPGKHQLDVYVHHGPKKKAWFRDLRQYDVVLTTFGSLAVEMKKLQKWEEIKARDRNATPGPRERLVLLAEEAKWYRVIIDEAQCIKNRATQSSKAASALDALHRWCMTGTPMMNGIEDLYAQLRFLHIGPFDEWTRFRAQFITGMTKASNEMRREASMRKFQALLKAVLLRRTKTSKIDGKPILQLPARIVEIEHAIFSEDESEFYKGLEQKAQVTVNRYLREGTVMRHYSNILVLLLRLRQACCHPHLIKDYAQAVNIEGIPEEQRIELAKQILGPDVARVIAANGEFECPVCYDATENPALMIPCGHDTCSECFAKITDPAAAIANGDGDGNGGAKCPQCRKPADANKVIDYNTFKKVHQPELWAREHPEEADEERASGDDDSDSDSETASEADDDEGSETGSLNGFIVDDDVETDDDDDLDRKPGPKKEKAVEKGKKPKKAKKSKKAKGKEKKKGVTLSELRKLGQRNKKSKQRYLRRLRREWITSAKIEKTLQILSDTDKNDPTEKTIIFSQFTSLLDLLEVPIDDMGFSYERYDGSMNAGMRADAVHNFMNSPNCKIILVSLKAGNAGLNLTAASSVIILDPFWNPFVEEQAIDRAHRIGQRREVKVHRVLVKDTVEDRIIELQEQKRAVIGTALDENASRDLSRLGVQQIRFLFGLGGSAQARD